MLDKKSLPDGKQFNYVSPNSDLLGWIIERSTGERFSDLLSDLLEALGATMPSYITVDRLGAPRETGGLCTTAIDLALVGQLFLIMASPTASKFTEKLAPRHPRKW